MSRTKLLSSLMLLIVIFASEPSYAARAHNYNNHAIHGPASHGHIGIGLYFGLPYAYPYYPFPYYPYSYYPPPIVVAPELAQPPVYIESTPSVTQQTSPEDYYWYYCEKYEAYYPYVKECPSAWRRVSPTPPTQK